MVKIEMIYSDISLIIPLKQNIFQHICILLDSRYISDVLLLQLRNIWINLHKIVRNSFSN